MTITETIATLKHMMTRCGTDDLSTTIRHGRENEALEAGIDALLNIPNWHRNSELIPRPDTYMIVTDGDIRIAEGHVYGTGENRHNAWFREDQDWGSDWIGDVDCWAEKPAIPDYAQKEGW